MEQILSKSGFLAQNQRTDFVRSLEKKIDWSDRLIGIVGPRGAGKTTMLLQRMKQEFGVGREAVYVSLDDIYFTENRFSTFAEKFRQQGGRALFVDEVHKYPDWARELKNIYDFYKDVRIIFTGSSIVDILRQNVDLSRRAVQYELSGLSFREYLQFIGVSNSAEYALADILKHHGEIATGLVTSFKPFKFFDEYLKSGYYPFFTENRNTYGLRLEQMIKMIIENDIRFIEGFDPANTRKVYQLLYILATNVPFKPNIAKLSEKTGIHRNTLVHYIYYLDKARLINTLSAQGKSISNLQKPDKIFLENTNIQFVLSPERTDRGTLRESFLLNQLLNSRHTVSLPLKGDFLIDEKYTIEVGGRTKTAGQLEGQKNAYVVADEMEMGALNKVPLWLFGFLY